ncbi:hypothetical protein FNU76_02310 [Chitinimonas arctica]|uniref:Uncharacterized protein n=1 Tax=Chitinimonas arctica TaxID=2594795 RepID=A0A516SAU2_9NEIS|nr:hypothetical protein [Chitinimonas arctica]QDQ25277.1 hypothetical protein FNU76_02310 [Chitinimonas arctica]
MLSLLLGWRILHVKEMWRNKVFLFSTDGISAGLITGVSFTPLSHFGSNGSQKPAGWAGRLAAATMVEGIVTVSAPFTVPGDDGAWTSMKR